MDFNSVPEHISSPFVIDFDVAESYDPSSAEIDFGDLSVDLLQPEPSIIAPVQAVQNSDSADTSLKLQPNSIILPSLTNENTASKPPAFDFRSGLKPSKQPTQKNRDKSDFNTPQFDLLAAVPLFAKAKGKLASTDPTFSTFQ